MTKIVFVSFLFPLFLRGYLNRFDVSNKFSSMRKTIACDTGVFFSENAADLFDASVRTNVDKNFFMTLKQN